MELDPGITGPLDSPHAEGRAEETLAGGAVLGRHAEREEDGIHEEDQLAARSQDTRRLGDPAIRGRPEAGAVFRDRQIERLVAAGHALGVGFDQRELETVLALQATRGRELGRRRVEPDDRDPAAGEPRRDVGRAAPELDARLAGEVFRQEAELRFRDAPDTPGRLLAGPRALAARDVVARFRVPAGAVAPHVLRERVIGHAAIYRSRVRAVTRGPGRGGRRARPGARGPSSS